MRYWHRWLIIDGMLHLLTGLLQLIHQEIHLVQPVDPAINDDSLLPAGHPKTV